MSKPVSIIIATHNRRTNLKKLISNLSSQVQSTGLMEIFITDDGSDPPVKLSEILTNSAVKTTLITQKHKGQSSARNNAIRRSKGDIIIIVDDDMIPCENFVKSHVESINREQNVSFGKIQNLSSEKLPSFEQYHIDSLQKKYSRYKLGHPPAGTSLCTGNVAFTRHIFNKTDGFDESLARSEDRELGIQLQKFGAQIYYNDDAVTSHHSDHRSARNWRKKAQLYGIFDSKIAEKHCDQKWASPWNFVLNSKPIFLIFACQILLPTKFLHQNSVVRVVDRLISSSTRLGKSVSSITYPYLYISGILSYHGKKKSLHLFTQHLVNGIDTPISELLSKICSDFSQSSHQTFRYQRRKSSKIKLLTHKAGLQILTLFRFSQFFHTINKPNLAKLLSRTIRIIYGSDLHPETKIEGGVSLVHGFGVVTSSDTVIRKGSIIFHNVTLGMGRDKATGKVGSPVVDENTHIGPGVSIAGPFTIGKNTKIAGGVTINQDIPSDSIVFPAKNYISTKVK